MIAAIPQDAHIVKLDIPGKMWTTLQLAESMQVWLGNGQSVALLIGGSECLSPHVRQIVRESWSLSNLTFPNPLVRIVVAEQLYRAWTVLHNHPYHRE